MKSKRLPLLLVTFLGLFIFTVFSALSPTKNQLPPSTYILNLPVGNQDESLILTKLQQNFSLPPTLTFKAGLETFTLNISDVSLVRDDQKLISQIKSEAKSLRGLNLLAKFFPVFLQPKTYPLVITYDQDKLQSLLDKIGKDLEKPYVPTQLSYDNKKIVIKPGQYGQTLDTSQLARDIISSLSNYNFPDYYQAQFITTGILPNQQETEIAQKKAEFLIGKSLEFKLEDNTISIDDKTLIDWLGFNTNLRQEEVKDYIGNLSQRLERAPINASFQVSNGKVIEFKPAQVGISLDQTQILALITQSIDTLLTSPDKKLTAFLPFISTEPQLKNTDVNNFGIKELLGKGTSTFKTSTTTRNSNVAQGAAIVNRILVAPGETFSFIKALGPVSLDNGFKQAYVIRQGKTELDVGGGICQVSTTFFRALLNAGLNITARQNHAYRVHYYEEDMPPGYDATVYIPTPDLKFINDTEHYVLIQNTYFDKERRLTYEIWGTNDGRKVEISNYRQWGASPPPPARYVDDPSLPAGKVVQDEHAVPGLKTSFDWKVTRNNEVLRQKTFTSSYTPWAAVYRRGPTL